MEEGAHFKQKEPYACCESYLESVADIKVENNSLIEETCAHYNDPTRNDLSLFDYNDAQLKCGFCSIIFNTRLEIYEHIKLHAHNSVHFCLKCFECFHSEDELKKHIPKHQRLPCYHKRKFECNICGACFKHKAHLNTHTKKHLYEIIGLERPYKCGLCPKQFTSQFLLKRHKVSHSDERNFNCDLCRKSFKYPDHLRSHRKLHQVFQLQPNDLEVYKHTGLMMGGGQQQLQLQQPPLGAPIDESCHKCEICAKTFPSPYMLRRHRSSHSSEKNFQCEICNKTFKHHTHMRTHVLRHESPVERPYECPTCSKPFPTPFMLKRHQISHSTERKFKCNFCDKMFKYENHMRIHERQAHVLQTGLELRYKCDKCSKGFSSRYSLKRHHISHSEEKNFGCEFCDKKFKYESHLKGHIKKHAFVEDVAAFEPKIIIY